MDSAPASVLPAWTENCMRGSLAILLPNLGGFAGAYATRKAVKTWYKDLKFPKGQPPAWVFAPMWTALYCGMGYASYRVWKTGGGFDGAARLPLMVYGGQLALNWAWSPIFFVKKDFGMATAELGLTLVAAGATAHMFGKIDMLAGALMVPYLAWLSYASYLCYNVWKLNKKSDGEIKSE